MYQHGIVGDEIAQYGYQQDRGRYQQVSRIEEDQKNERVSPASSTSSIQDTSPHSTSKLKKRSSSTSSGLRTLGRIFGAKKNKSRDQFNRQADSDSELSFNQEASPQTVGKMNSNGVNTWAAAMNAADFDRRKRKKNELLEEAIKARTPFALWLDILIFDAWGKGPRRIIFF